MELPLSIALIITSFIVQLQIYHPATIESITENVNSTTTQKTSSSQTSSSGSPDKSSSEIITTTISSNTSTSLSNDIANTEATNTTPINLSNKTVSSDTSTSDPQVGILRVQSSAISSSGSRKFRRNYRANSTTSILSNSSVSSNTSSDVVSILKQRSRSASAVSLPAVTSNTSSSKSSSSQLSTSTTVATTTATSSSSSTTTVVDISNSGPTVLTLSTGGGDVRTMIDKRMTFIQLPNSLSVAQGSASYVLQMEQQFSLKNEKALYIFEPSSDMNWADIISGKYDTYIDEMFRLISIQTKAGGLDVYSPFPEPNLPIWNNASLTKQDFGLVVNKFGSKMKKYLPNSTMSLLFDSKTYESDNSPGYYLSLLPFVQKIDKTLINSIGLQGFHWIEAGNPSSVSEDPYVYLSPSMITEIANFLEVKKIWVNTGTLRRVNTISNGALTVDSNKRAAILSKTSDLLLGLKNSGFEVMVNIFMEDKFNTDERNDWSYPTGPDLNLLTNFFSKMKSSGIQTSVFVLDPYYN